MKKANLILREILHSVYERNKTFMSQKSIAEACDLSSETVNRHVTKLYRFKAINKKPQGFKITNSEKILQYWTAIRDFYDDIVWSTHSAYSMTELEAELPKDSVLTAFSGYRNRFGETPTPYNKVYAYADPKKVKKRFSESEDPEGNLIILETDPHLKNITKNKTAPLAQIYVDLWQIGTSMADRYRQNLKKQLEPKPLELLRGLTQKNK